MSKKTVLSLSLIFLTCCDSDGCWLLTGGNGETNFTSSTETDTGVSETTNGFPTTSGATDGKSCLPGETFPCLCPPDLKGVQTCNPDGQSLGDCDCGGETTQNPTTGLDTDSTTEVNPDTGTSTTQDTDTGLTSTTDTGEECQVINCDDLDGAIDNWRDGAAYIHQPNCDDGLQAREVLDIVIESYQMKYPWLTLCFGGDPTDLKAVANWLNLKYDGLDQAPATSCLLSDMLAYEGGPILSLKPGPDGNYGLGEKEKVVTQYCYSGAHTEDDQSHIGQLLVVNTPMGNPVDLSPAITARLECEGSQFPLVLEDGVGLNPVDCSTPNGIAGSLHIEVDIAEQGGQVGDQFRLGIVAGQTSGVLSVHLAGKLIAPLWTLQ